MLVEPPGRPEMDFRYRIFNADGGEVEQCGNGARCFARFVRDKKLTVKELIRVETAKGDIELRIEKNGDITVNMGEPVLDPKKLAALQSKLSTAAQKQANDLTRVQQVVERRRTTPGVVPPASGALYPGLKVWMPPAFAPPVPPGRS